MYLLLKPGWIFPATVVIRSFSGFGLFWCDRHWTGPKPEKGGQNYELIPKPECFFFGFLGRLPKHS